MGVRQLVSVEYSPIDQALTEPNEETAAQLVVTIDRSIILLFGILSDERKVVVVLEDEISYTDGGFLPPMGVEICDFKSSEMELVRLPVNRSR